MPYIVEIFYGKWYKTAWTGRDENPVSLDEANKALLRAQRTCPKEKYRITEVMQNERKCR